MKPGTRVILTRDLDELKKGSQGTVVIAKEHASMYGMPTPSTFTGYYIDVTAVHFDEHLGPSIGRTVDGKYTLVKDHCHAI